MRHRLCGVGVYGAKGVVFFPSQVPVLHIELDNLPCSVCLQGIGLSRAFMGCCGGF
jgi:hypothetical protein